MTGDSTGLETNSRYTFFSIKLSSTNSTSFTFIAGLCWLGGESNLYLSHMAFLGAGAFMKITFSTTDEELELLATGWIQNIGSTIGCFQLISCSRLASW
jgi:hypothetical protein